MRSLGQNPTEAELKDLISEIDSGIDNTIDFPEFLGLMSKQMKNEREAPNEIQDAFKLFDKQNKGEVSVQEFKHVLTTIGEKLTEDEVDDMIKEAGIDKNGVITLQEFLKLMQGK